MLDKAAQVAEEPGQTFTANLPPYVDVERFRAARSDRDLVVLEGFHALKHALRFGAEVEAIVTPDDGELRRLLTELAPDVVLPVAPSGTVTVADGAAHLAPRSATGFSPATFGDELLRFDTTVGDFNGGWFGFSVRSKTAGQPVWTNSSSGYLVVIKEDVIEFQRWAPDVFMIDIIDNDVIAPGSTHEVTFGAVDVDGGTRVVLRVDGEPVWSHLDRSGKLTEDGYLHVYRQGPAGEMSISPAS
jgi:hypothetical protein